MRAWETGGMAKAGTAEGARGTNGRPLACPRCETFNPRDAETCASCGLSLVHQALADRYTQAPWQLALLSIFTFSLYDLYWCNRTWRLLRDLGPRKTVTRPALLTL